MLETRSTFIDIENAKVESVELIYHKNGIISEPIVMTQLFHDGVLAFFSLVPSNGGLYVESYMKNGCLIESGSYKSRRKIGLWHINNKVRGMICKYFI